MTVPVVPFSSWIAGAFDPVLILVAVWLGWKADQIGKVFIAAIVALALSVLASWLITTIGLPWVAPISREGPILIQVRVIAAAVWAAGAYFARRIVRRA